MSNKKGRKYQIAIGIPAYNEEQTLPGCIKSISRALNYLARDINFQVKILICENGSTDKTLQVATALKRKLPSLHIRVLTSGKGMVEAEKTIIKAFQRNIDFIFKIDADTLLKKDALSIIIKEFLKHPELKIVGGHSSPINYKGKSLYKRLLDKILNVRGYFPQSEVAKYNVREYHFFAFSDPQTVISPEFESKSKIYFHGRFFCTRGKNI